MQTDRLKTTMIDEEKHYSLRGQCVTPRSREDITIRAKRLCLALKIRPSTVRKIDRFIEKLRDYGINVEVAQPHEWVEVANAVCDPATGIIMIPHELYSKICEKKDQKAIFILFHEIGHIILGHKALLHYQDTPCRQEEDSEWQADFFSECILRHLKLTGYENQPEQLVLEFR